MRFEYSNNIHCTKEEAWALITDLERRPEWIHFQEKCYWLDQKPDMVGSTFQEKEVFLGFHMNVNYKVTAWKEYQQMTARCDMPPFHQTVDVVVRDNNYGTVYCALIIEAKMGVLGLLPKSLIKNRVDAIVQPMVDKFKEILEEETKL